MALGDVLRQRSSANIRAVAELQAGGHKARGAHVASANLIQSKRQTKVAASSHPREHC